MCGYVSGQHRHGNNVHLVLGYLSHGEIPRPRMGEIDARHAGGRRHAEGLLVQGHAHPLGLEQLPERGLLGMVGLGRVAGRRADAVIHDLEQFLGRQALARTVAPPGGPHHPMQVLRRRLGQSVGQRLHHETAVVVPFVLVTGCH